MLRQEDLIDRAIHRIRHIHPDMNPTRLEALEDVLRSEFGGTPGRTAKRGNAEREAMRAEILRLWRDKSVIDIARALGIHRSTVHRVLGSLRNQP